jgi:hypothetical protein
MNYTPAQRSALAALVRKYGQPPTREGRDGKNIILHFARKGELTLRMYRIDPNGLTTPL